LYCGILLVEAGHIVTIFEASDRIHTYHDPKNLLKYNGELGAMCFRLNNHSYVYSLIRQRYKLNITSFFNFIDNIYMYTNGIFARNKQIHKNADMFQLNPNSNERTKMRRRFCLNTFKCYERHFIE